MSTWLDEIGEDITAYCAEFNVPEERVIRVLSIPLGDPCTDEEFALVNHFTGWAVRHYGLQDIVTVSIERQAAHG